MQEFAELLRSADLRVTRPRLAVLEAVQSHPHADTDSIFAAVRAMLPEVSRQAVYDVLAALNTAGLVRRIQPSGSVARYEARVGDNHHHVVCRGCGAISDIDCRVGDAPCLSPIDGDGGECAVLEGFVLDEAEVIYWGRCPDCSADELRDHNSVITAFSPKPNSERKTRG
jgi:Fur family ferric uptake transcriptional regulator